MRDRLIELIKKVPYGVSVGAKFEQWFCEKVANHLLENGVIVPPCKVGDVMYCVDRILEIAEECTVYGFYVFRGKIQLCVDNGESKFVTGSWYASKEEAEKALKGGDGDE